MPDAKNAAARGQGNALDQSGPRSRAYDDPCGVARALDLVGDRWALLIVRELLLGPKRFVDLQRGLPRISPTVLSQRLRDLDDDAVVAPRRVGPPVRATVYELTGSGRALEPVLLELARWGSRTPVRSVADLTVDALVLALRTTVDPRRPAAVGTFELRIGDDVIALQVNGHTVTASRTTAQQLTAAITTDVATLRSVVFAGYPIADAVQSGALTLEGDRAAARRFLRMFSRPRPFGPAA